MRTWVYLTFGWGFNQVLSLMTSAVPRALLLEFQKFSGRFFWGLRQLNAWYFFFKLKRRMLGILFHGLFIFLLEVVFPNRIINLIISFFRFIYSDFLKILSVHEFFSNFSALNIVTCIRNTAKWNINFFELEVFLSFWKLKESLSTNFLKSIPFL